MARINTNNINGSPNCVLVAINTPVAIPTARNIWACPSRLNSTSQRIIRVAVINKTGKRTGLEFINPRIGNEKISNNATMKFHNSFVFDPLLRSKYIKRSGTTKLSIAFSAITGKSAIERACKAE